MKAGRSQQRRRDESMADFFARRVIVLPNGCWLWPLVQTHGYGVATMNGRPVRMHRWAYEHFVGPIPEGLTIDHLCQVRPCVNPRHLEPVTRGLNCLRGNSPHALNHFKTHCKHGHPFSGDNLQFDRNGDRECRTCRLETFRRSNAKDPDRTRRWAARKKERAS